MDVADFSVGRCRAQASKPVRANNMEITRKICKDLLLLECYARPNNPRQQADLALLRSLKNARGASDVQYFFIEHDRVT